MKFLAAIPLVFSIVGFVLVTLATFAGRQPGFMEDYAVVRLNMSGFGKDLLPTGDDNKDDDSKDDGIFDKVGDLADDALDKVTDELQDIANDGADKLADALGISEWYSLHLMDSCEGNFEPNATSPGSSLNVTNCTDPNVGYKINLTELIDKELDLGPFDFNLADLEFPDGIQRQISKINGLLMAVTIFYLLGMGLSGLCIILAVGDFVVGDRRPVFSLLGLAIAGLAFLCILIGAALTSSAAVQGAETITDIGENVGVYAYAGKKFIIISWVSCVMIGLACTFWAVSMCQRRRARKDIDPEYLEKTRRRWRF